jgi:hypothetical protein
LTSVAILQWEGVWDWPPLASVGFKVKEYHNSVHTGYAVAEPYKNMFSHKDHSRLANLYQNPLKVEFILGTVLASMSWRQWLRRCMHYLWGFSFLHQGPIEQLLEEVQV